ncbi:GGDEF domain-containing protein [Pseudonocardia sp. RS11V-5]|uniref:sensor domain-containing diguanylate cyclase n=1 Tax=Pseudonocardia terrae TaxID=2905831 RepID=UPI001E3E7B52|nr:GGDEF domain-containing protein [Pseudonocardia terrae]MCE3551990.1 GGDEF domain-containing protein [Pseudonocardia terrae]
MAPVVADALLPTRSFDVACRRVLEYLQQTVPLGGWAVTRVIGDRQVLLRAEGNAYELPPGTSLPFTESLCHTMVEGITPRIAPDVREVPQYAEMAAAAPLDVSAYVGTPIVSGDGWLFGTVCGYDPSPQPEALRDQLPLLDLLSGLLSAVLDADLSATAASRELERARHEAETDALTGLLNRRGRDRFVEQEEDRFRRFGDAAAVVVLDLDNLKTVNDLQGHDAGDEYIRRAGASLAATVRRDDVLARLGGDEFGIIAVGATPDEAAELVGRAERALAEAGVSGSFGHAPYSIVTGFPGAWKAADEAMYAQKRARRAGLSGTAGR